MLCIRGATTVENNDKNDILQATKEMIERIIKQNELAVSDILQMRCIQRLLREN